MEPAPDDPRSPALANAAVLVGFAVIFTTFVTGSPWSWILGGILLVAGALWAGAAPGPVMAGTAADGPAGAQPPTVEPVAVAAAQEQRDGHAG